ncbi:MAG: mechanosensitive ion channel [Paludibacter sp.]|nr:mechanosensitive ion channel [Paludibacter sp.]
MDNLNNLLQLLTSSGVDLGKKILAALVIYIVGRWIIKLLNKMVSKTFDKRDMAPAVKSFVKSLINVSLIILLLIAVISALGVETTSFAALLASAGIAIGMALSGSMQNFAGGVMILIFKPFKVGDYIESQGIQGAVKEIQIFNTIINTVDNKTIIVPNSSVISNILTNFSHENTRRVDFSFGVDYGTDYEKVKSILEKLIAADKRILKEPAYFIGLKELADSSVNITVRAWTNSEDYWGVFFDMQKNVYETFNKEGISFPFPQLTVHQAQK